MDSTRFDIYSFITDRPSVSLNDTHDFIMSFMDVAFYFNVLKLSQHQDSGGKSVFLYFFSKIAFFWGLLPRLTKILSWP